MRKYIGLFLVIVGGLIFLANFFPGYSAHLSRLAVITNVPFWGVVLVLTGGYFLLKNEKAKTSIGVLLVLFIVAYLLGAAAGTPTFEVGGWSVPTFFSGSKRIEGEVSSLGSYGISEIEVRDVAAKILFMEVDGETTDVSTNLPLSADQSGDKLILQCTNNCKKFKNGELTLEVGRDQSLEVVKINDTVGDISFDLSHALESMTSSNFVGELEVKGFAANKMELRDFIGDVSLGIKSLNQFEVNNGIGDVKIRLPANYRIEVDSESLLSKINTKGEIHSGSRTLKFGMNNMIGQVTLSKPDTG